MHRRKLPDRVRYRGVSYAHPFQSLRFSLIDARRSLGVFSCPSAHALGLLPVPRFVGVTRARSFNQMSPSAADPCKEAECTIDMHPHPGIPSHGNQFGKEVTGTDIEVRCIEHENCGSG